MLKQISLTLFTIFILGLLPQDAFSLMTMESKIQKFELKNCRTEKKCLKLTADKAQSSQFLPLYVLKNIKMELQQAEKTKTFEALTGYIDFNQDTVQLDLKNGDELLLDLKTLEEKNFYK